MEASYQRLIEGNKAFIAKQLELDPDFFTRLAKQQRPEFLWVGCSDSRVPANEITNTDPGEVFVHRNIANVVVHTDLNFMSVLQYSVEVLKVKHIIVCGHYGCGGVEAAMGNSSLGLVNKWVRNIKEVYARHEAELDAITDRTARFRKLVEFNVMQQVENIAKTSIVQKAWQERPLHIHGWVYGLDNGNINELPCNISGPESIPAVFRYQF